MRLFLFCLVSINLFSYISWSPVGPGGGSDLLSIAIHPQNPDIVYLSGDIEGIWKTTDGGTTWKFINNNLAKGAFSTDVFNVNQIKFDPNDPSYNTLYICTLIGVFKTTNGGNSWNAFFPDTFNSNLDFMVTYSIAIDPSLPTTVFVGTFSHGVWRTTDGGLTWDSLNVPLTIDTATIFSIFIDPLSPQGNRTVYIVSNDGVYKSTDNGNTWSPANTGLPHKQVWNLDGVVVNGNTVLYLTLVTQGIPGNPNSFKGGFYKSTNGASSWTSITGDLPTYESIDSLFYFYKNFAVNPLNPQIIYIGTYYGYPDEGLAAYENWGIYKTYNGGLNWIKVDTFYVQGWMDSLFFDERHALVLAMAPSDTNIIYWGRDWMAKSTDAGATWQQIYTTRVGNAWKGNGLEMMMVEGIAFDPSNSNIVYVGYDDMGLFKSIDGGNSFTPLDSMQDPYGGYDAAKDILIDPSNTNHIYLSRYDGMGSSYANGFGVGQVWRSTDGGISWQLASNGLPEGRPDLVLDPVSGGPGNRTLYCASYGNGVYKTTNSGASWSPANNGLGADAQNVWIIAISPNNNQEIYVGLNTFGAGGGIYKTTNGGASWTKLTNFPAYDVLNIKIDPSTNNIYACVTDNFDWSTDGGVFRSTDGGNTWTKIFSKPRVSDVEISPTDPNTIFTVYENWYNPWNDTVTPGVFRTFDGGQTWNNITGNLQHTYVVFLKLDPDNTNRLYAGTGGGGLWMTDSALVDIREFLFSKKKATVKLHSNFLKGDENLRFISDLKGKITVLFFKKDGRRIYSNVLNLDKRKILKLNFLKSGLYFLVFKSKNREVLKEKLIIFK